MAHPAIAIPNLLYRYAQHIDAGEFTEAAALFQFGHIRLGPNQILTEPQDIEAMWRSMVRTYSDGTCRTRHLITNPIIELSEDESEASVSSSWTVIQQTESFPLAVVASGRYQDTVFLHQQRWWFREKAYLGIDLIGDMSAHLMGRGAG